MPSNSQYDVAIVGASIAGCAAAIFFGRAGAHVALIERDRDSAGYKKVCTHFIQASATPTLEKLGLASAIEDAGGLRNDIEIFTRWGWIVAPSEQTIRRPTYGYNLRRSILDPMLRKTAAQTVGVEFFPGFSARELLIDQGRICGVSAQGEGDAELSVSSARTGETHALRSLLACLPKRLQTVAFFISRTTAICR
jgi:menaquinone-9 beta-reductase